MGTSRPTLSTERRRAVEAALRVLAPRLPDFEREAVIDHALMSRGLRGAEPANAAWLALVAYARHTFTDYDALLDDGYDRDSARYFVLDALNDSLREWGVRRLVDGSAEEPSEA